MDAETVDRDSSRNSQRSTVAMKHSGGPSIGLAMIVKNEAHVIRRCLTSVLPIVDYILIADTGSTDGTQETVRDFLRETGLPGRVVEERWQDFAHNRTQVLQTLRKQKNIDYAFVIDADDELVFDADFDPKRFKANLTKDAYSIEYLSGRHAYRLPRLFRNSMGFHFKSVLHEYLDCDTPHSSGAARGLHVLVHHEGARSRMPDKYIRDTKLLEESLAVEADPRMAARYTFYLAQAYYASAKPKKALETYLFRAEMGFGQQEVYMSLYRAAQLKAQLGYPAVDVLDLYKRATEICPARAEALYQVARICREHRRDAEGYVLAKRALAIAYPEHGLFVDTTIYRYALLDEFVGLAYRTQRYDECLDGARKLLADSDLPSEVRTRIQTLADLASGKLAEICPQAPLRRVAEKSGLSGLLRHFRSVDASLQPATPHGSPRDPA